MAPQICFVQHAMDSFARPRHVYKFLTEKVFTYETALGRTMPPHGSTSSAELDVMRMIVSFVVVSSKVTNKPYVLTRGSSSVVQN